MMKPIKRNDVIQAVQIAAKDAAQTSTNPIYVEALELAARALRENDWVMPRRRTERIRGISAEGDKHEMLIPGTVLVSDCCKAIVIVNDKNENQCVKCMQPCTASQTLSEAAANTTEEGAGDG